jgi:DNA-binding transcriptional LysR family regulator
VELRDIEIFLTLAEELHFGRTAERLHVSPARVSQAIKKQERVIGAELFMRTSRSVLLTPAGERLRDELAPGYRQIQEAITSAAAAARGISGVVRVGYAAAWCGVLIIKAAEVFRESHPACEVQIVDRLLNDRFGLLRTREIDLQLTEFPAEEPDITTGPVLFREPRLLMMSARHPFAGRESVSVEDYAETTLITLAVPEQYVLDYHLPRRTPQGRPIQQGPVAASFPEVQALVAAGKGVWPIAQRGAEFYARPDIAFVPFHDAPTIDFGLTWLTDGYTAKVQAFVQVLLGVANVTVDQRAAARRRPQATSGSGLGLLGSGTTARSYRRLDLYYERTDVRQVSQALFQVDEGTGVR